MEVLFSVKKVLGVLISPFPVTSFLLCFGVGYILIAEQKKHVKRAKYCLASGVVILLLASSPMVAFYLLRPIELAYPKYEDQLSQVDNIVVLGCYNSRDEKLPALANIHPCSLFRLVEAFRLAKIHPAARVYLTGWQTDEPDQVSHPEFSAKLLNELGLARARMKVIAGSRDTEEEVKELKPFLQDKVNLVVSSASHFYRAVHLFKAQGVPITPVPVEYLTHKGKSWSWQLLLPDAHALKMTERAVYEYLGNIWVRIKA